MNSPAILLESSVRLATKSKIVTGRSSKHSMRNELRKKTEEFLKLGGEIKQHNQGETGEPADKPRARSVFVSGEPRQTRTYINDVVNALDSRKKKKTPPKPIKVSKRPKKKIIYDDFGEAVREVWTDEPAVPKTPLND